MSKSVNMQTVVVPYFILIWYNQVASLSEVFTVVVPYFILIWYNIPLKKLVIPMIY